MLLSASKAIGKKQIKILALGERVMAVRQSPVYGRELAPVGGRELDPCRAGCCLS